MFYKVVKGTKVVDALSEIRFIRAQEMPYMILSCDKEHAQGIISSNDSHLWYVADLIPKNVNNWAKVKLVEIDEEEYNILKKSFENPAEEFPDYIPEVPQEPTEETDSDDMLLVVKQSKIKELAIYRDKYLEEGFYVNEVKYGFNKTDQQNMLESLTLLMSKIIQGDANATVYYKPYGAGLMEEYSTEMFMQVVSGAEQHKLSIWNKYNTLVLQVEASSTIQEVDAVKWE